MSDQTTDLPDLPELESVGFCEQSVALLFAIQGIASAVCVAAAAVGLLRYHAFLKPHELALGATPLVLTLWVFARILFDWSRFATDPNGLTLRRPLGSRFIPWYEVTRARIEGRETAPVLFLDTGARRYKLHLRGFDMSGSSAATAASIYQHLRRLGTIEAFEPTETMRRIWMPLPESVPCELDWQGPVPRYLIVMCALMGLAVLASVVFALGFARSPGDTLEALFCAGLALVTLPVFLPPWLYRPRSVRLREDYIEARLPFRSVYIPWGDVVDASLHGGDFGGLTIRARSPSRRVILPFKLGDPKQEEMVLAAIRRLRRVGVPQALALPVTSLTDPDDWNKPGWSGGGNAASRAKAYLQTLEPDARRRLSQARWVEATGALLAACCGFALGFSPLPARLSCALHTTPDAAHVVALRGMVVAVPLFLLCIFLGSIAGPWFGRRLASGYPSEWARLQEVTRAGPWEARFTLGMVIVSILAVAVYLGCFTRFTPLGIETWGARGVAPTKHAWHDVRAITETTRTVFHDNRYRDRTGYRIAFTDGSQWSVSDPSILAAFPVNDLRAVLSYAEQQSGKKMGLIRLDPCF